MTQHTIQKSIQDLKKEYGTTSDLDIISQLKDSVIKIVDCLKNDQSLAISDIQKYQDLNDVLDYRKLESQYETEVSATFEYAYNNGFGRYDLFDIILDTLDTRTNLQDYSNYGDEVEGKYDNFQP